MQNIIPSIELIFIIDMLAAVTFAVSGSLVASRKGLDIVGFMWLSIITGVGGGTLRDLLLDVPVFWILNPAHIIACTVTAIIMFFAAPFILSRLKYVLWFDAIGLAFVTVVGTVKGIDNGTGALIAIVMGVITASFGGVVRDIIGGEKSIIMRQEIYVTAAVIGATTYVCLNAINVESLIAVIVSFIVTFLIRGLAIIYNWSMPSYYGKQIDRS